MNNSEMNALYEDFLAECREIQEQCVAEGYHANGSNYELRVESLMKEYPKELFASQDALGETVEYKGYTVEYNFYGNGEYSVQYDGDDVIFNTAEEAKDFIDSVV